MKSDTLPSPPIEVRELRHSYGNREVLRGLDLAVAPGEIYALLGGNGAGKSTTVSALLGFIAPLSGTVRVAGIDPVTNPAGARAQLAYVPESVALYDHLTARENVDYFLALAKAPRSNKDVIEPALDAVGLAAELG
jgi:ABC-2 type transport system ATP-binding protein